MHQMIGSRKKIKPRLAITIFNVNVFTIYMFNSVIETVITFNQTLYNYRYITIFTHLIIYGLLTCLSNTSQVGFLVSSRSEVELKTVSHFFSFLTCNDLMICTPLMMSKSGVFGYLVLISLYF